MEAGREPGGGGGGRRGRGGGRRHREQDPDVRLSKALAFVLRHGADELGFTMGSDGFLFVDDLLPPPPPLSQMASCLLMTFSLTPGFARTHWTTCRELC
ncbi:tRNA 2'-phosphotransferase 1 [Polyodon spathula]|uniref:tRNA 2'-phosphotransferase 1 n=1 Tax=Polyodon spathula TaxID=7913 RepID=UPI001B7F143B|nr:tRNA 2'-phosphotransferase 1 [Polyodon spathula]